MIQFTPKQRDSLAKKIIQELDKFKYSIDSDTGTIKIEDDEIIFSIFKNKENRIAVDFIFENVTITDSNIFWENFYPTLYQDVTNEISIKNQKEEMEFMIRLNSYINN